MSAAQMLLRRLLDVAGGAEETGYLLVLEGDGLEDLPETIKTPKAAYGVHRVQTEIGLRHLLWKAKGAPLIAVMPHQLAEQIQRSPDLLRRARNQRIHALAVNDVLEVILGVRVVGADAPYLQQLALEHVTKLGHALTRRTLPTVIDRRLLTELLVDASVGEQVRSSPPAELLAAWLREPPQYSDNVKRLVSEALPTLHGDEGRVLAWALAEPETHPALVLVHGAVLTVDADEVPKNAWGPLWAAAASSPISLDRQILRRVLARLAEETLTVLGDEAVSYLQQADAVGRRALTPSQLQTSHVLPLAFEDRCHALAQRAVAGKAVTAKEVAWLAKHRVAPSQQTRLAVIEAMARLSRFLDQPASPPVGILDKVRDYQRQGAFADLAVLQLRRALAGSETFHAEGRSVMSAVRERRNRDNLGFAETLAGGYEAGLHCDGLVPLHRIWKREIVPVWQDDPDARIYVVVMDGCSYPVFLELLHALAQDSSFPIGMPVGDTGVHGVPALAPLPTITSHARGAIFLGELPQDPLVAETVFREKSEAKTDPARLKQNASLEQRSRRLFLKRDLTDGGQELLRTLRDDSVDVIATVFNAVDDQIGSSNTGALLQLTPETIVGFKPSLKAALEAGRRVLITADHGHSPFVNKELRRGKASTPRFTELKAGEKAPDGFLEIDVAGLGGPPAKRAFAWESGVYLGSQQVGFHGGCSLEEMVVPLAWLRQHGLAADEPAWWFGFGVIPDAPQPPRPAKLPVSTPAPERPAPQYDLFDPSDKADSLPLSEGVLGKLSNDEKAVLVLIKENGEARATELAQRLNKNPGRLNGLLAKLRRTLHAAGVVLYTSERLPSGETLYRYKEPGEQ